MKKIIAAFSAVAVAFSMLCSVSAFAEEASAAPELVAGKGTVKVDGKISSGEWDGAATVTVNSSNSTTTVIKEGETPYDGNEVKLSFKYDDEFIYILEERTTDYLYTAYSETYRHQVYCGDSTDVFLSLYLPEAKDPLEQKYSTSDILFGADSADRSTGSSESVPIYLFRTNSFYSTAWSTPDNTNKWSIDSTVAEDMKSAVTEVAVSWDSLFQENLINGAESAKYKDYIQEFAKAGGLALKFAVIVHEGNSNRQHCYSLAYGAEVVSEGDWKGTSLVGDDIAQWPTLYLGEKNDSATGQIDLESIVENAKLNEGKEFNWNWVIIPVAVLVVIAVIVIIVFRIFGIKVGVSESDGEDDDEDEDDEEEDEDEGDEEEEE